MRVLVDGYNVVFTLCLAPRSPDGGLLLAAGRKTLLRLISQHLGPAAQRVLVVFDAQKAPSGTPEEDRQFGISVVFTKNSGEADDWIEAELHRAAAPQTWTVVSSDHRVRLTAKRRGARVVRAEEFLEWLEQQQTGLSSVRQRNPNLPIEIDRDAHLSTSNSLVADWLELFQHLEKDPKLGQPLFLPEDLPSDLTEKDFDSP